jgi:bifunctional UDP-N-acetylglucosamine pyrophosphorylase/glucosamine-1-phosphate N-acetyltransferase
VVRKRKLAKSKSINKKKILALVLMAGKGTRMKSDTPKVLHPVMGKPMGWYVLDAIAKAGITRRLVVVGYGAEMVQKAFPDEKFVLQKPQSGTGHAVLIARDSIPKDVSHILVINGDSPLLTPKAVKNVVALLGKRNCKSVVSCDWTPNPGGLGRFIFDESDNFVAIRESSDLKRDEKDIDWVNVGLYGFEKKTLFGYLDRINSKNKQREL